MNYLYYHGGSSNHGCEAIVRSTAKILEIPMTLFSTNVEADKAYNLDLVLEIKEDKKNTINKKSLRWLISAINHKLTQTDYLYVRYSHSDFFKTIKKNDVCFSIGGDNYCYEGRDVLGYYNRSLKSKGAKTVLWGCSFEPKDMTPSISCDIARYDLIVARESISYNLLKTHNKNVILAPDPAFFLDSKELPLPNGFLEYDTVGINISPLIMSLESEDGIAFQNYVCLVNYILKETKMNIALIPHVVEKGNDDREIIARLHEACGSSERIVIIDDHNAEELKGFISRCRFFVGARTHATIAAYSTCVPTLVVGYSVKARGIARDLFGVEENYVLNVQNLKKTEDLKEAFTWISNNEKSIKEHLSSFLPEYLDKMNYAINTVREMVKE